MMRMSPNNFNVSNIAANEFNTNSVGYANNTNVTSSLGVRARFLLRLAKG